MKQDTHKYREIEEFKEWLYRNSGLGINAQKSYYFKIMSTYRKMGIDEYESITPTRFNDFIQGELNRGISVRVLQGQMSPLRMFALFILKRYKWDIKLDFIIKEKDTPTKEEVGELLRVVRESKDWTTEFFILCIAYNGISQSDICKMTVDMDLRNKLNGEAYRAFERVMEGRYETEGFVIRNIVGNDVRQINLNFIYRAIMKYGRQGTLEKAITPRGLGIFYKKVVREGGALHE